MRQSQAEPILNPLKSNLSNVLSVVNSFLERFNS